MRVPELCVQRKVSRAREYSRSFILPLAIISLGKWKNVNSIGINSWEQRGYSIISVLSTTHLFVKISINHVWKSVMCLLNFMILSAKWKERRESVKSSSFDRSERKKLMTICQRFSLRARGRERNRFCSVFQFYNQIFDPTPQSVLTKK